MPIYLSNRDGNGKTSEEGHYRLQTRMLKGFNLFENDLKVTQNSPLGMSILITAGDYRLQAGNFAYTGWLSTNETRSINTADTVNPRIDTVVIYIDKSATTSPATPNNPNIAKIIVIPGNPAALPVATTTGAIEALIGAANPYFILATIQVGTNVSQIVNANITDLRTPIGIQGDVMRSSLDASVILPVVYPIGSIYFNADNAANPATILGFGTWATYAEGRMVVGAGTSDAVYAGGSTGGASTVTLTTAQMPSHDHAMQWRTWFPSGTGSLAINDRGGDGLMVTDNAAGGEFFGDVRTPITNEGGGAAHNNMPPYITAYAWKRTA